MFSPPILIRCTQRGVLRTCFTTRAVVSRWITNGLCPSATNCESHALFFIHTYTWSSFAQVIYLVVFEDLCSVRVCLPARFFANHVFPSFSLWRVSIERSFIFVGDAVEGCCFCSRIKHSHFVVELRNRRGRFQMLFE